MRFKQRVEKDSVQKIAELRQQHEEVLQKLLNAEEILKSKQREQGVVPQTEAAETVNPDIIPKKQKEEIVYAQKRGKAQKSDKLFDQ